MNVEERIDADESILARYDGEVPWVLTDRRLFRGGESVPRGSVRAVERVSGGRDLRYLVVGLAALTLAVLVPTGALAAGIGFFTVAPVTAVLALLCPVGLVLWFRSSEARFEIRLDTPGTERWWLPADGAATGFAERLREDG